MFAALVPLWEAPLEVLSWYGCETCYYILLNFFFGYKTITLKASLEVSKSQKLHRGRSGDCSGWGWLEFGSSLKSSVLRGMCDVDHCCGTASNCLSVFLAFSTS